MGILENLQAEIKTLKKQVKQLTEKQRKTTIEPEWASVASLATKYTCSKSHIANMAQRMAAVGCPPREKRMGNSLRYHIADFDKGITTLEKHPELY